MRATVGSIHRAAEKRPSRKPELPRSYASGYPERENGSEGYQPLLRLIPLIRCQGINMSTNFISSRTASLASPPAILSSSSSRFRRLSITTPLSFTSNRGPSSGSKLSPTRTTISSPIYASGIDMSAMLLLLRLLPPRILSLPRPSLPGRRPPRATVSRSNRVGVGRQKDYR